MSFLSCSDPAESWFLDFCLVFGASMLGFVTRTSWADVFGEEEWGDGAVINKVWSSGR